MRLFSTEQVTKYHPDKYADQISDAVLDACLNEDQNSRVACECMVKGETVVLAGEITTKANPNYAAIVNRVAKKLGYKASNIITYIDHQSPEIANGVDAGGAGDQGMMYGAEAQTDMMIEEMSELTKALLKHRRKESKETLDNILEEIADVQIMLDQMKLIHDDGKATDKYRDVKLLRLAARLGIYTDTAQGGLQSAT